MAEKENTTFADGQRFAPSQDLYSSLFENSHSIMVIVDPETGAIKDANTKAVQFYGYTRRQLRTMHSMDINILPPEEIFHDMQLARSGNRNCFNFRHRLASGDIRDVEVYSGPITFEGRELLYCIIHDITERKRVEREKEELIARLQKALAEIKTLRGILPICASCKKIRDDRGYWNQIESYIHKHSEADFSHGLCPECAARLYPGLNLYDDEE